MNIRETERMFKEFVNSIVGPARWRNRRMGDGCASDMICAFAAQHPGREEWLIYQSIMDIDEAGLSLLPVFIKTHCPQALIRQNIRPALILHDYRGATLINSAEQPYRHDGPGFSERYWFGEIDIEWHGTPIHFFRHFLPGGSSNGDHLTLIATKSRKAMVDLWQELRLFWKNTYGGGDAIVVTTGGTMAKPQTRWEDLVLPSGMMEEIRQNVETFFRARKEYEEMKLPYRRGFLLCGPPGTGKTSVAKAILANTDAKCLVLPIKEDIRDDQIESAFRSAADESPAILLIEDLDKLVSLARVSMSYLLGLLDGIDSYQGFVIVATTNEPEKIDKALLHRPSRFDRVWQFGLPGLEERRRLLVMRSQGKFSDEAIVLAAQTSAGMTMAAVQEIVVSAMLHALHEGRQPVDADLTSMAKRLQEQCRSSKKATGAIPEAQSVGFVDNGFHAHGEDLAI